MISAAVDRNVIEGLLFAEARLLDRHRLTEWLGLWADDRPILYWVPYDYDDVTEGERLSLICDDRYSLERRTARLELDSVLVQDPRARMSRIIGNVEATIAETDHVIVTSKLVVHEYRKGVLRMWPADVEHTLAVTGTGLKIQRKVVRLLQCDGELPAIAFLF